MPPLPGGKSAGKKWSLDVFEFFRFKFSFWFLSILVPPYCGIGATIRIGQKIRCLLYAGFLTFYPPLSTKKVLFSFKVPFCVV